jgi:hypothetical protein
MQRVTRKHLEGIVARINAMTDSPAEPYRKEGDRYVANLGNYHLSGAYGGWALHQMASDGGGTRDVLHSGHVSARELQGLMFAYIAGRLDVEHGRDA